MAAIEKPGKPILMKFGLLGTILSKWSFRHLKYTNLSIGDDFIYSSRIFFSSFSREAVASLQISYQAN